jgi:hypothetical protein
MSRQDSRAVDRTVAAMETLAAEGVAQVSVSRVLQLLGRGTPVPRDAPEARPAPQDPRADPLTGCLPVTASGGHDGDTTEARRGFRG